ncbi:hypothetical protein QZJ86_04025 [Methylomonas montana]|uniref:hypothetical protein n=1 Tax=Methylomonas montana TaxID=3058963 RepID=UPI00265ACB55|nr:hypothetical protein [Methylomonas montana]WKJ91305.1 hypothetical protein QZJ86_04025 [Methylomonas montana]
MNNLNRFFRLFLAFALLLSQTGCLHWLHAYQTYLQMDEFDHYFAVTSKDDFTVHFKQPKLFSEDFVALAKLHASSEENTGDGKKWRYWFRKIDKDSKRVEPEISFYLQLAFNKEDKITDWTFSNLFLQIAPPEFLEASFRSLGGAEINEEKKQLRAKADQLEKIAAILPKKATVIKQLGEPLEITQEEKQEVYLYHFRLDAKEIEEGYEDRALSEVRLMFDKETTEMVKMSGRFAGLKISINYRDYQDEEQKKVAGL